ncbi:MAG: NlpC/P60 family protein [Eubacteriales bacterium]
MKYNEPAKQGLKSKMDIDCSRLVNWAVTEVNPFWGEYGIGKGARHQIYQSEAIWDSEMGEELKSGDLQVGDTLFWRGDETDKVTHTAIYIGSIDDRLLMIESGNGGVHIEEIRMEHIIVMAKGQPWFK